METGKWKIEVKGQKSPYASQPYTLAGRTGKRTTKTS